MNIYYITSSSLPSNQANSIHVVNMANAFASDNHSILLFCQSQLQSSKNQINDYFGLEEKVNLFQVRFFKKGRELWIAVASLIFYFFSKEKPDLIFSRNTFAAYFFSFLNLKITYETHAPEKGIRKIIQRVLLNDNNVKKVFISDALKEIMRNNFDANLKNFLICADAAPAGRKILEESTKKEMRNDIFKELKIKRQSKLIGYFGAFYSGRGIETIIDLAKKLPDYDFILYGGTQDDFQKKFEDILITDNLFFGGFINPKKVIDKMSCMDLLLMPYSDKVSIGLSNSDTSKWMSPMKMFEYMSSGVPFISSDISVLREVLIDEKNCLLCAHNNMIHWKNAIQRIFQDKHLYENLKKNAFSDYELKYNWQSRVRLILNKT